MLHQKFVPKGGWVGQVGVSSFVSKGRVSGLSRVMSEGGWMVKGF